MAVSDRHDPSLHPQSPLLLTTTASSLASAPRPRAAWLSWSPPPPSSTTSQPPSSADCRRPPDVLQAGVGRPPSPRHQHLPAGWGDGCGEGHLCLQPPALPPLVSESSSLSRSSSAETSTSPWTGASIALSCPAAPATATPRQPPPCSSCAMRASRCWMLTATYILPPAAASPIMARRQPLASTGGTSRLPWDPASTPAMLPPPPPPTTGRSSSTCGPGCLPPRAGGCPACISAGGRLGLISEPPSLRSLSRRRRRPPATTRPCSSGGQLSRPASPPSCETWPAKPEAPPQQQLQSGRRREAAAAAALQQLHDLGSPGRARSGAADSEALLLHPPQPSPHGCHPSQGGVAPRWGAASPCSHPGLSARLPLPGPSPPCASPRATSPPGPGHGRHNGRALCPQLPGSRPSPRCPRGRARSGPRERRPAGPRHRRRQLAQLTSRPRRSSKAAKRTKPGKAPGPDGIPTEVWLRGGPPAHRLLSRLFSAIGSCGSRPCRLPGWCCQAHFQSRRRCRPCQLQAHNPPQL